MHDEMLTLFDDCITRLLHLRDHLAATRRVRPGERRAVALSAIVVAERFATTAAATITPHPSPVDMPARADATPAPATSLGVRDLLSPSPGTR